MSLLLYERHSLSTKLSLDECLLRLEKTIGQQGCLKEYLFGTTPYYGMIIGSLFSASRIKPTRLLQRGVINNTAVISGRIIPGKNGCTVDFEIGLCDNGKIAAMVIGGMAGILFLACLFFFIIGSITANSGDKALSFFGMVLITLPYMIAWVPFKIEAITCRNDFYELFGVEVEI